MAGETHLAVGVASVLAITQPTTLRGVVLAIGTGAIGAVISDIDVGSSGSRKGADKVIALTGLVTILIFCADYFLHTGIWNRMVQKQGIPEILIGMLLFVGTCIFGMEQPHRTFMHSLLALLMLEIALNIMMPSAVVYFGIGFLSHIITDFFNFKKVRVFYPCKKGICFKMFHACGLANSIFLGIGIILSIYEIFVLVILKKL